MTRQFTTHANSTKHKNKNHHFDGGFRLVMHLFNIRKRFETFTDSQGTLAFYDLPTGSYRISATLPPNMVLDVDMYKMEGKRKIYPEAQTSNLDQESMARFMQIPYGLYDLYVHLTGEDTSKPSWTHDKAQIDLNTHSTEITITLRKSN